MAVRLIDRPVERSLDRACASRGERLRVARRLDWRFLLPSADLGCVGYFGAGQGSLLPALQAFVPALAAEIEGAAVGAPLDVGSLDLVVAQAPTAATIARTGAVLRDGGWLYAELASPLTYDSLHRLLRQAGFADIVAHWHHPDFDGAVRLLPVDAADAFAFVLARGRGALARGAAQSVARLLRTSLARRILPCVSVIARRTGAS